MEFQKALEKMMVEMEEIPQYIVMDQQKILLLLEEALVALMEELIGPAVVRVID